MGYFDKFLTNLLLTPPLASSTTIWATIIDEFVDELVLSIEVSKVIILLNL